MVAEVYPDWTAIYPDNATDLPGDVREGGNRPDAEDLTAEVFAAALRPLRVSASVGEVRAYLLAAARTVLAGYWRRTLGREVTTLDEESVESVFAESPEPSGAEGRTAAILGALPEHYRRILELRFLDSRTVREAAVAMGISTANAKVLQHRACAGRRRWRRRWAGDRTGAAALRGGPAARPSAARLRRRRGRRRRAAHGHRLARRPPRRRRPRAEFVDALQQRLAADLDDPPGLDLPQLRTAAWGLGRRGLLVGGAAVAAASAAVGVLVDRTLLQVRGGEAPETLTPTSGDWRTVVAGDQLPEGGVHAFDLGAVVGFVARTDGVAAAVSGICTHQGCRLLLDAPSRQLDCPCHRTVFAVTGELVAHQLPVPPAPLPHIATREVDGAVQVYTV